MEKPIEFKCFPGTEGYISENGIELIITKGDVGNIKKFCTVTNKAALFQCRQLEKNIIFFKSKLKTLREEGEGQSRAALRLEEGIEGREEALKQLRKEIKKEYWGETPEGLLSLPAGFWWMCEK